VVPRVLKFPEPPSLVPGPPQSHREAFGVEGEDVDGPVDLPLSLLRGR
jgi:hypothetical protein